MESKRKTIRMIESVKEARHVRTDRSIASLFLGYHSRAEHMLFVIGVKNEISTGILWSLWFLGSFGGLLVVAGFLPKACIWISLLMLPLPTVAFLLLSKDLVCEILEEIDFYVVSILQTMLFLTALHRVRDQNAVFWISFYPTMMVSVAV